MLRNSIAPSHMCTVHTCPSPPVLPFLTRFVHSTVSKMPATSQLMNETLMDVEHTPPVHKRILDVLPGVSGGVARIMVGQPFDTIKTRLQVLGKGTIGAAGMPPEMVYTSGMDCVRKMVSCHETSPCS